MIVAEKIWCPAYEAQPEGLFNKATCPEAPANWFREDPEYAAQLFAMERFNRKEGSATYVVHVLDNQSKLHVFTLQVGLELTVRAVSL